MITAILRYRARSGFEEQVRDALFALPAFLYRAAGFWDIELLSEPSDPALFLVLTRWTSQEALEAWQNESTQPLLRRMIQLAGLPEDHVNWEKSTYSMPIPQTDSADSPALTFQGAIQGISAAVSRWLSETEAIVALLITRDGAIRLRNRASQRVFRASASGPSSETIWDYLICSDAEVLRSHLSETEQVPATMILNIDQGERNPLSIELGVIDCGDEILLLGGPEQKHSIHIPDQFQALTNKLTVMARELGRKNKELTRSNQAIQRLAQTDMLTRLANRDLFYSRLEQEIARSRRQSEPLTLIMADLDEFKTINDQYGHVVGDHVLAETGRIFSGRSRPYDLAARYGGDEFALLLPKTDSEGGRIVAERLREDIQTARYPDCPAPVRMSLGVATLEPLEYAEALVIRADAALYASKGNGGNRVSLSPVPSQKSQQ